MTPQYQTVSDNGHGDCLRACIASILDMPIDALPMFDGEDYDQQIDAFLEPFDMYSMFLDYEPSREAVKGYNVLFLRIPDQEATHAVVAYGDKVAHDPSGYNAPTDNPVSRIVFINMFNPLSEN